MSLEGIKAEIEGGWPGQPAAKLCLSILDYLVRTPADELQMITFRELSNAAGQKSVDATLLAAIAILKNVSVLNARALLVDDADEEHELDPVELAEAQVTGQLYHPQTGDLVQNYADHVIPFFVPTDHFLSETHGH